MTCVCVCVCGGGYRSARSSGQSKEFGDLFVEMAALGTIVVGLYRNQRAASASAGGATSPAFVFTAPPAGSLVTAADEMFVLAAVE